MDKSYISRIVQKLVNYGFIVKQQHPQDHRSIRMLLTPEGREAYQAVDQLSDEQIRSFIQQLSAADQKKFFQSIQKAGSLLFGKDED